MRKCKYKYWSDRDKKCPHKALEGKDVCYWHEKRNGKDPAKELRIKNFSKLNLSEAYLRKANLREVNLQESIFLEANLQKGDLSFANLQGADLEGANLQKSNLLGVNLKESHFLVADLQESNLMIAKLQKTNLWETNLQDANLRKANLSNSDLTDSNLRNVDFYQAIFKNSNLSNAKHIDEIVINEREGNNEKDTERKIEKYDEAKQIYLNLKNYFKNEGIYDKSGIYYIGEMRIKKKIANLKNDKSYCWFTFWEFLCDYGETPEKIIKNSIKWILICSIVYFIFGIETYVLNEGILVPQKVNLFTDSITQFFINFWHSLYFSIVTFTTLGYGDFHPIGVTMIFAVIEAFSGAFMLALFVLTMGRKMMR